MLTDGNDAITILWQVGLVSGVALIVGTMIGSGIFVSPSTLLVCETINFEKNARIILKNKNKTFIRWKPSRLVYSWSSGLPVVYSRHLVIIILRPDHKFLFIKWHSVNCCNTVHKGRKSGLKKKCSQYLLGCVIYNATAKSHAEVFTKQSLSLTFDLTCSFQAHLVFKPRLNRI